MYKKKSLGQHFLNAPVYLERVADALQITKGEQVVEIGPGEGALTSYLLQRGAKVTALEKDVRLLPILSEKFKSETFSLIEGDALEYIPSFTHYKVVGNIPYYITGALFRHFLTLSPQPSHLVFLVQKEVAERIARSKKESILSLSVKAYGTPLYIKTVPAGAFSPPPAVDSAIIAVENISRSAFDSAAHEEMFFMLLKQGFGQKRKLLKSNLGERGETLLLAAGLDQKVRAEDVPLSKWLILARSALQNN